MTFKTTILQIYVADSMIQNPIIQCALDAVLLCGWKKE
jgi:hypothetical protein